MNERLVARPGEEERLDKYLARHTRQTRSHLARQIEAGEILVNGKPALTKQIVREGDEIEICAAQPRPIEALPENIPLAIVYEDADIAVINKSRGMVVHPAAGNATGTLVNALLYCMKDLSGINGELRPGIVHRIDKDTTGLLVVAKNDAAHQSLAKQIKEKSARRTYFSLVAGNLKEDEGTVDAPIGRHRTDRKKMAIVQNGRVAVTHWRVLERFGSCTLVEATLETGRTHQIRVHMAHIGHGVVGDPIYGGSRKWPFKTQGQLLHAAKLELTHPVTGERMTFTAPLPEDFFEILSGLRKK